MSGSFTESTVEEAALAVLGRLGWAVLHGPEIAVGTAAAERSDPAYRDVVLERRLRAALARLNPGLPAAAVDDAFRKLTRVAGPTLIERNRALHRMLVDGVTVEYRRPDGSIAGAQAQVIDFERPEANDWLAVNQFTVVDGGHERRPDVVLFLNGLPVAVIELKNPADEQATIHTAYRQLVTYQAQIPALFEANAVLVTSDGTTARIGALGAGEEWFKPWRTIEGTSDAPQAMPELRVLLEGVFEHRRFLDLVRHFVVFEDPGGGAIAKKIAGYHQFHAVNAAVEETIRATGALSDPHLRAAEEHGRYETPSNPGGGHGDRRVGVVWHTQGSGKSLTMAFYAGRIVLEPAMANPTLVVLTDRNDLDDQLFGTFARCHDLLRQEPVQAQDRADLRAKLAVGSGGVVFTTIQKFLPDERGDTHPVLSDRRNIVVIADEAHRSQYDFIDGFARHLRDALPGASFIGFTGTPIELTDANTRSVFGDYISVYDIERSVRDGATVPIYYESRLAKLALAEAERPKIDPAFEEVTEGEEVDRKEQLKSRWAQLEALVGRRAPGPPGRRRPRPALRGPPRDDGRQGDGRHDEPANRGRPLPRDRRAAARVGRDRRRRRRAQGRDDRVGLGPARLAGPHPQQAAAGGARRPLPRPSGPVPGRDRARHVAHRVRRPEPAHDVPRQADARARPDAGDRAGQPCVPRQTGRARRGLPRHRRRAPQGARRVHRVRRDRQGRDRPGRGRGPDAREVRDLRRPVPRLRPARLGDRRR